MSVKKAFLFIVGTGFLYLGMSCPFAVQAQDVDQPMREALERQQDVQKDVQDWNEEKKALVQEILSLRTEKKWLELQNDQHAAYIEQKKQAMNRLQEEEEVARSLRMELEPYLSEVVDRLGRKVEEDLPFLPQERQDRLQFINQSLTEYGVSLSERLRRVLEALSVEAGYGSCVEATDRELTIQGTPTQAKVVRIGRVDLFYVTRDGDSAGKWDKDEQTWKPLARDTAQELLKAVDIIQERRVADLVTLPLEKPEE